MVAHSRKQAWKHVLYWPLALVLLLVPFHHSRPAAALATPIEYGQTVTGNLAQAAQIDSYTFLAQSGDMVFISASRVSGQLWPEIRLLDAENNPVADNSGPANVELTWKVLTAGSYTILIDDGFDGSLTGVYTLFLQRLNDPAGATIVDFGQTTAGQIGLPSESESYAFTAQGGDRLLLAATRTSGDIWPRIRLYDHLGNLLGDTDGTPSAELIYELAPEEMQIHTFLPLMSKDLPSANPSPDLMPPAAQPKQTQAGDYFIMIGDGFNGTLQGAYNLYLQRLNAPPNAINNGYNQTVAGQVQLSGAMQPFSFNGQAGEVVLFNASRTSGEIWPRLRLFDATGQLLYDLDGTPSVEFFYTLPTSGAYALLAGDGFNNTLTGGFHLNLERIAPPFEATTIQAGDTISSAIEKIAETDAFSFSLPNSAGLIINASRTSGEIWPRLRLFDSAGLLLADQEGTPAAEINLQSLAAGQYLVLVSDGFNATLTGGYNLNLTQIGR